MYVYDPKIEQLITIENILITTVQENLPSSMQDISNVYHFLSIKEVCTMSTLQKVKI